MADSIRITVDDADWQKAMNRFMAVEADEGHSASKEAAELIADRTKEALTMQWHGPGTKTPSAPGMPPAAITGELAASVVVREDFEGYLVGPTTDYGREQELGGPMEGHPYMHWFEDGVEYYSAGHSLPDRPYLKPSADSAVDSGEVHEIYFDHWKRGQEEVAG